MPTQQLKDYFLKQIEAARDDYVKDLEAMSEEDLGRSVAGSARTPLDFSYEVAVVNRRIAMRLRGETPPVLEDTGWITAPTEARTKAAAIENIRASLDEVIAAWNALPAEDVFKTIQLKSGESHPLGFAFMAAYHTGYHDAQLNYIQSLNGDMEVHWN